MGWLFTNALTYGGAVVSLFWPFCGLLIYFCFAIVKPESMWYWSVPAGNYSRIVAIALLVGWAARGFGHWTFGRAALTVYSLLGLMTWMVASAMMAPHQNVAWAYVESMSKIVLPFLVGVTLANSVQQLKQIAWVLVLSLGYVAFELNLSYFHGFNRLCEIGFGGMDNNTVSIAMVCGAGLAFFLGLSETSFWRRWVAFGCAGLMAHTPMFGMSRGGMLALIVTGVVTFVLIPKEPKHYLLFALALVIALRLAGPSVWERFSTVFADPSERDASAESRIVLWGQCWNFMLQQPIFGIGPDNFPIRNAGKWGGKHKQAHSVWMQTGAELGFPGLFLLVSFYGSVVWRLWRLIRSPDPMDPWLKGMARMVIASLAGFAVAASFVTVPGVEPPYYVALIGVGVLKIAYQRAPALSALAPRLPSAAMKPAWMAAR